MNRTKLNKTAKMMIYQSRIKIALQIINNVRPPKTAMAIFFIIGMPMIKAINTQAKMPSGFVAKRAPKVADNPPPPLNLKYKGQICPITMAKPTAKK